MNTNEKAKLAYDTYADTLASLTEGTEHSVEKVLEWEELMIEDQMAWEAIVIALQGAGPVL